MQMMQIPDDRRG